MHNGQESSLIRVNGGLNGARVSRGEKKKTGLRADWREKNARDDGE